VILKIFIYKNVLDGVKNNNNMFFYNTKNTIVDKKEVDEMIEDTDADLHTDADADADADADIDLDAETEIDFTPFNI